MFLRIIASVFLIVAGTTALAEESPVQRLKAFLASATSMTADFTQMSFDEKGTSVRKSKGVFSLQRPGKFRWDYQEPFRQEIVSDSEKVWFYDEDLEQVTIKRIDQAIGATPAVLLSGEKSLEENFIMQQQGTEEGLSWVRLIPKSQESGFKYILIGMNDKTLGGMELNDNFGQLTRIYFSNLKTNVALDAAVFEFKAPPGVDVFGE
ncbi:MAG: outer membrane lipoprotein chaperone LolA [Pseudomonadota bacterium]